LREVGQASTQERSTAPRWKRHTGHPFSPQRPQRTQREKEKKRIHHREHKEHRARKEDYLPSTPATVLSFAVAFSLCVLFALCG
jgi:hypothetical protein